MIDEIHRERDYIFDETFDEFNATVTPLEHVIKAVFKVKDNTSNNLYSI